ncbi:uncharacterized protein LOC125257826 [Megalobrama amblycephala]|uniref:uncharacterized protein LOC125257826 n=1 Tax=Megalobrama amblycephala TaxID=75352 RepID=UPI0020146646|nr:uncharacterized protein LOC125257826 [Megalobrama amblycephala]XP_048030544.1 uncharacterized protein LOC125257826 [Megalobrama amblycephala]
MAESTEGQKMASLKTELHKFDKIIKQSSGIDDGIPALCHLTPSTNFCDESEPYRKMNFGERDKNKPHKTILMVGETGTGKTKLINVMINYMLGVQREDKVWFEITDDQSNRTQAHSQTSIITVYGFYLQESQTDLTIIDTPGYGNTRSVEKNKEIGMNLLNLSRCDDRVHEIDAVCLVIMAHQNRLSDRQIYIFDAVQSLFGRDINENIVLLFTHSRGSHPKNALTAVKEAEIKSAMNDKKKPVFFLFDNCQSDTDEDETIQEQSWNLSFRGMTGFRKFLDKIKPKALKMTQDVLQLRKQLEETISNVQPYIEKIAPKKEELKQTQEALGKEKEYIKNNENFEYEVEVKYKEWVDIDRSVDSVALCCTVCEENCHYPGCWWVSRLAWCVMMKDNHCTVCKNKCHYSKHVKGANIYVTKTKKEKRTNEALKKEFDGKIGVSESLVKKLEEELKELEDKKIKLVMDAFHCVGALELIALNTDSLITLMYIDFLIDKLKEINETQKVETLENIKKRAGEEKQGALKYIKKMCL